MLRCSRNFSQISKHHSHIYQSHYPDLFIQNSGYFLVGQKQLLPCHANTVVSRHCDGEERSRKQSGKYRTLDCFRLRLRNDGHAGDCFIVAFFATGVVTPFQLRYETSIRNDDQALTWHYFLTLCYSLIKKIKINDEDWTICATVTGLPKRSNYPFDFLRSLQAPVSNDDRRQWNYYVETLPWN
jgi:hypothetical protein